MVIQGYSAARHDRFAADPAFLASGFDLSGVGRAEGGGWVTLLKDPGGGSPTHFVSADHAAPSGTVHFFTGNDPNAATVSCSVGSGSQIGLTDIWVGTITGCDTSSLTGYEIAPNDPSSQFGQIALQAGVSSQTYGALARSTTNMRWGRNKATFLEENTTFIGRTGDWMIYQDDSAEGDLIHSAPDKVPTADDLNPDETFYQGGDSGGPSFLESAGQLLLVGVHSFKGELSTDDADDDGNPDLDADGQAVFTPVRRASGDAYLPSSRAAILSQIDATAVPEPSAFLLIASLAAAGLAARRTRLPF